MNDPTLVVATQPDVAPPQRDVVSARRRLARLAATYAGLMRECRPSAWDSPAFARQVAIVRWHLAPLCDRSMLAASFAREGGSDILGDPATVLRTSPTVIAYAIRWHELHRPAHRSHLRPRCDGSPR